MARIRSIHPGLFTDEGFMALSSDAQVFFLGLWTEADDQGVFEWKPLTLKVRLRGGKDGSVDVLLDEIAAVNGIRKFEITGRAYGAVRNFRKFQRPKKPNAVHPITDEIRTYVALSAASTEPDEDEHNGVLHQLPTSGEKSPQMEDEGGRMKDEGGNKKTSAVASRTPPADDTPVFIRIPTNRFETEGEDVPITEKFIEQFQELYPAVDVRAEVRAACAWCVANRDKRKTRKGMTRYLNAWLGRQQNLGVPRETRYGNGGKKPSGQLTFIGAGASLIDDIRAEARYAENGDDYPPALEAGRPLLPS